MTDNKNLINAIARLSRMTRRHPKEAEPLSDMGHHILHLVMEQDGVRTTELAELAGVRPASLTDALDRLEKYGFIVRKKDIVDSRVKRVYITEKTREHIEIRSKIKQKKNEQLLACLTEEEADVFLTVCDKLCAFLESEAGKGGNHG